MNGGYDHRGLLEVRDDPVAENVRRRASVSQRRATSGAVTATYDQHFTAIDGLRLW